MPGIVFCAGYTSVDMLVSGIRIPEEPLVVHFDPSLEWQSKLCDHLMQMFGRRKLDEYVKQINSGEIDTSTIEYVARLVFRHHGIDDIANIKAVCIDPRYTLQTLSHFCEALDLWVGRHPEILSRDAVRFGPSAA